MHDVASVVAEVKKYATRYVTVTGGEPLAQKACLGLLTTLCDEGYEVSLETSGAMDVSQVDPRVVKVLDIKTPGSGEVERNLWANLEYILPHDQIKFVVCDQADYEWSKDVMNEHKLTDRCEVLFSPSATQVKAGDLGDWVLRDQLRVRLQIQLHKYLWGDAPGR
jgi:7-carboxy-7-deazaguanine synthase